MQWFDLRLRFGNLTLKTCADWQRSVKFRYWLSAGFLMFCLLFSGGKAHLFAQQLTNSAEKCPVIPKPLSAKLGPPNEQFHLTPATEITLKGTDNKALANYFRDRLQVFLGDGWAGLGKGTGNPASKILLECTGAPKASAEGGSVINRNGYQLNISSGTIHIQAPEEQGLFYGLNTLLQLVLQPDNMQGAATGIDKAAIPCWEIRDQPALAWRGFMLDESRHFFGKDKVKEILDWMAFYKLNSFHWHLTDAPGWRLAINAYPKLTTIGSIGNKTDSTAEGKFYTQDDIREIVAYAKKRFIQVVPEIDMPGHATAANRAYPAMSGGGTGKYADFTFNPGKKDTYTFLTKILEETSTLFPVHIVHLGGDEVAFGSASWNSDAGIRQLMAKENLKDLKAIEFYFLRRMADSALHYNKRILVWDEATDARLPTDKTTIMWWRHDKLEQLRKALDTGYSVVFCPRLPMYFDFVQDSSHRVGRRWKKLYVGLKRVFNFWPAATIPKATQYHSNQILGLQANLWSETVETEKRLDFLVFPRIAALATAGWTPPELRKFPDFLLNLKSQFSLYQKTGIYYFNYLDPGSTPEPKK